jgi:protein-disulfide isomerase
MNFQQRVLKLVPPVDHVDHAIGPTSAKATLVEFGDFECPSCFQAQSAIKILLQKYDHRIRFIFRHFPLREVHPHAELAAEAAEAAGAQGKFWQMHDLLFENQLHLKLNNLRNYARLLELDMDRFEYEIDDHVYLQRVQEHIDSGLRSGVRATPGFFVNEVAQDVSFGYDGLQSALSEVFQAQSRLFE